ncbi:hypothetical protein IU453_13240 [Nocardia cyriacigeorgica]|uniref:hypothetical protein n=1 Tax=Nocardia cyriacigeorgica TaxID=135487 RepID=UPI001893A263|nr:hypothetical protein [Nocardia cyriacigeorgica]MBF6317725.1 hypothetical protein [Nocardia cyriacigeorgica]MBF6533083.1 hypothetical protein [Nocardia cyriacigeorgica]
MSALICQYCSHRDSGGHATCTNCGAPLTAPAAPAATAGSQPSSAPQPSTRAMIGTTLRKVGEIVRDDAAAVRKDAEAVEHAVAHAPHPRWQWQAVGAAIVVLLVLGFLLARSCSVSIPPPEGTAMGSAVTVLPTPLRAAASCRPIAESGVPVERCVVAARHPMLSGSITSGRDLIFHARLVPRTRLNETVGQWRSAGSAVLADGAVFAALSASAAVQYANPSTGLLLDTGAFASSAGAREFLSRAGLLQ